MVSPTGRKTPSGSREASATRSSIRTVPSSSLIEEHVRLPFPTSPTGSFSRRNYQSSRSPNVSFSRLPALDPQSPKISTQLPSLDPQSPKISTRASTIERPRHIPSLIKDVRTRRSTDQQQNNDDSLRASFTPSPSGRWCRRDPSISNRNHDEAFDVGISMSGLRRQEHRFALSSHSPINYNNDVRHFPPLSPVNDRQTNTNPRSTNTGLLGNTNPRLTNTGPLLSSMSPHPANTGLLSSTNPRSTNTGLLGSTNPCPINTGPLLSSMSPRPAITGLLSSTNPCSTNTGPLPSNTSPLPANTGPLLSSMSPLPANTGLLSSTNPCPINTGPLLSSMSPLLANTGPLLSSMSPRPTNTGSLLSNTNPRPTNTGLLGSTNPCPINTGPLPSFTIPRPANTSPHLNNTRTLPTIKSLGSLIEHFCDIDMANPSSPTTTTLMDNNEGRRFSVTSAVSYAPSIACLTDRSDFSTSTPLTETFPPPQPYVRSRRTAISSEPVTVQSIKDWNPPVYPKSEVEESRISQVISTKLNLLFAHLTKENEERVVSAMFKKHVSKGTVLIKQGDEGDNFYIVDEGSFEIFVQRDDGSTNKVQDATPGMSFGELALMYNAARAATCVAAEDSVVWALDRLSFRMLLVTAENTKKKRYESLLERIEIFKGLTKYEHAQLSDILVMQECKEGECVIRQKDRGDKFYIVESGELLCKIKPDDGPEIEVHRYHRGGYFGELALVMKYGIRKASVYSVGNDTRLLWIGKSKFDRVLGPIIDILRKNASLYPTYAQLLKNI